MKQKATVSELSALWQSEDSYRESRFSEPDLALASELILGTGNLDSSKRAERLRSFMTGTQSAPEIFGEVASRTVQALYRHQPPGLKAACQIRRGLPNWNENKTFRVDGLEGILPVKQEGGEYSQRTIVQNDEGYRLATHGLHFYLTEEAQRGDIVGALESIPERMARSALRTEQAFLCSLIADANGPLSSVFNQQGSVSALPLTITNLETAVGAMLSYSDS